MWVGPGQAASHRLRLEKGPTVANTQSSIGQDLSFSALKFRWLSFFPFRCALKNTERVCDR